MLIKSVLDKKPIWGENCFFADNATLIGNVVIGDYTSCIYMDLLTKIVQS